MVRMEDKFGVPITENTFYKDGQGAVKLITKDKKGSWFLLEDKLMVLTLLLQRLQTLSFKLQILNII